MASQVVLPPGDFSAGREDAAGGWGAAVTRAGLPALMVGAMMVAAPLQLGLEIGASWSHLAEVLMLAAFVALVSAGTTIRGRHQIYLLNFQLFFLAFVLMPIMMATTLGIYPRGDIGGVKLTPPPYLDLDRAVTVSLAGYVAFMIGHLLSRRRTLAPREARLMSEPRRSLEVVSLWLVSSAFVLGLATHRSFAVFFGSRDGRADTFESIVTNRPLASIVNAWLLVVPAIVSCILLWLAPTISPKRRRSLVWRLALFLALAGTLVFENPLSAPRQWSGPVLFAVFACYLGPRRIKRWLPVLLVGYVFAVIFAFPYADYFRRDADRRAEFALVKLSDSYETGEYGTFTMIAGAVSNAKQNGLMNGEVQLGNLFVYVPTSVWPSKPPTSAEVLEDR